MSWRDYDPEQLEWQYNPRVTVPDFQIYLDRVAKLSDQTRGQLGEPQEIRYGTGPLTTFDLFRTAEPDAPVHIFFHGGYWRSQDKRDYAFVARDLVPRGINVVVANYDLCPAVTVAEINRQCVECIEYLLMHGETLDLDITRLTVSGHSAGAQIVARLLTHPWQDTHPIRGALAISGIFDVEPIRHTSLNDVIGLDENSARAVSPCHEPPPPSGIPVEFVVGGDEPPEFHRQTREYARHCASVHEPITAEGFNHFDVLEAVFFEGGVGSEHLLDVIAG